MDKETWKDIPCYEGLYKISNYGKVYSYTNNRLLILHEDDGYLIVRLNKNNIRKSYRVHILVMSAFVGVRPNNQVVNHKDGNKQNNYVGNLAYVTQSENSLHVCHTLGRKNIVLNKEKVLEIIRLNQLGNKIQIIAETLYVSHAVVERVLNGSRWGKISGIKYHKKYNISTANKTSASFIPQPLNNDEIFLDIADREGLYKISNLGRVFNMRNGKFMTIFKHNGYPAVVLTKNKKQKRHRIHILLMETFVGKKPEGYVIDHKDLDRSNNDLSNLEYVTRSENALRATLGYKKYKLKKEQILEIVDMCNNGYKRKAVAEKFGVSTKYIGKLLSGTIWSSITGIKKQTV